MLQPLEKGWKLVPSWFEVEAGAKKCCTRSKGVSSKPPAQCSLAVSYRPIGGDQARVQNGSRAIHCEMQSISWNDELGGLNNTEALLRAGRERKECEEL
jgi:hypothetical protein